MGECFCLPHELYMMNILIKCLYEKGNTSYAYRQAVDDIFKQAYVGIWNYNFVHCSQDY